MDILQQASQTLSFKNALTNYHNGTSARIFVRSFDNRQRASRNGSLLDIVCVQSNNPNDRERMLLASSNTTYAAPLDAYSGSSFMIRPLAEILRDLNKRVPDQVLKDLPGHPNQKSIPWYHANRMLSFYAPGWCGEVRNIMYSADGQFITVTYRVTLRGSDGEVFREAAASVCLTEMQPGESVQQAEALAFVRACARFGLGLYLHHEEEWSISSS
ncbi:hypothetical protein KP509_16G005900 [Ceratopteris richardii]|uniref:Uncharacterized protein n=1 Tax=Ceratopteris richardii TaxID=49495 RepID=A0A8T2T0P5_CERRI|nr:hypothetical protein KP509_16G005900 [Ceratopteris richardii]